MFQWRGGGLCPDGISQRDECFLQTTHEVFHPCCIIWAKVEFCSLFASDLEQLRVLLHDVHQHVVDVAPQVQVHVLLVLQRLPHLVFTHGLKLRSQGVGVLGVVQQTPPLLQTLVQHRRLQLLVVLVEPLVCLSESADLGLHLRDPCWQISGGFLDDEPGAIVFNDDSSTSASSLLGVSPTLFHLAAQLLDEMSRGLPLASPLLPLSANNLL